MNSEFEKLSESRTPPLTNSNERQVNPLWLVIIIAVVSFASYFKSFFNGFVFDDTMVVVQNPWITDVKYLPEIFSNGVWSFIPGPSGVSNYYRPMLHVIYMMTYHIFGLNAWGFHFVNVLVHSGVSILVFFIGLKLYKENSFQKTPFYLSPPLVAAVLFAVHPIHTEVVAWVAGMPDLLCSFFYLFSFYLYLLSCSDNVRTYIVSRTLSIAMFFIACLSKEPALTLPLLIIVYDYAFKRERMGMAACAMRYAPYLATACIYFAVRLYALKGFSPIKSYSENNHLLTVFPLFAKYLQKLLLPTNLSIYYVIDQFPGVFNISILLSLFITAAFFLYTAYLFRKNRTAFFALSCIVIPLLPVFYIPGLGTSGIFAERYLYLPSVGFAIFSGLLFPYLQTKEVPSKVLLLSFTLLAGSYALGTLKRIDVWKDDYALWTDATKKASNGSFPHIQLGKDLMIQGRIDDAIREFQTSILMEPNAIKTGEITGRIAAAARNSLGRCYMQKGLTENAIEQFQLAVELDHYSADAYNNLGIAYAEIGWLDSAKDKFSQASILEPWNIIYKRNLEQTILTNYSTNN